MVIYLTTKICMDKKITFLALSLFTLFLDTCVAKEKDYQLSIAGGMIHGDGLGKIPILIIDCLKDLRINWIPTSGRTTIPEDVPEHVRNIALNNRNNTAGHVAILTDLVWHPGATCALDIPQKSIVKIAYSMIEATKIPYQWVSLLNEKFDSVVVPDAFLVDVYRSSGVKIPIFELPLPMYLEDFLKKTSKTGKQHPFVYGNLSGSCERKNHVLLLQAFKQAFGNSPDVKLIMNSRGGETNTEIYRAIAEAQLDNVEFRERPLSWHEYVEFMASLDCYVSFSKGEGFSFSVREALAIGVPVIISDNTAHSTLCRTGFVKCIPSRLPEPAFYRIFNQQLGYFYNSNLEDAVAALRDVRQNYAKHQQIALNGKNWVRRYQLKRVRKKYLNLVDPRDIRLGKENIITDEYIMTNSRILYEKYLRVKAANLKNAL